jgi:hypothetical protein
MKIDDVSQNSNPAPCPAVPPLKGMGQTGQRGANRYEGRDSSGTVSVKALARNVVNQMTNGTVRGTGSGTTLRVATRSKVVRRWCSRSRNQQQDIVYRYGYASRAISELDLEGIVLSKASLPLSVRWSPNPWNKPFESATTPGDASVTISGLLGAKVYMLSCLQLATPRIFHRSDIDL